MEKEFEDAFKDFNLGISWIKTNGRIYYGKDNIFQYYYEFHYKNPNTAITIMLNKDNTMKVYLDKEDDTKIVLESKNYQEVKDFINKLIKDLNYE